MIISMTEEILPIIPNWSENSWQLTFQKLLAVLAPLTGGFQWDNGRILSLLITIYVTYHKSIYYFKKM